VLRWVRGCGCRVEVSRGGEFTAQNGGAGVGGDTDFDLFFGEGGDGKGADCFNY